MCSSLSVFDANSLALSATWLHFSFSITESLQQALYLRLKPAEEQENYARLG